MSKLVKHCAKPIDICGAREFSSFTNRLFRGHVAWRPQNFLRARNGALCLDQPRESEVGEMRFAFLIEQNVTRLDVAMKDTVLMRIMDRARDLRDEFHRRRIGIGSRLTTSSSWPPSTKFMLK